MVGENEEIICTIRLLADDLISSVFRSVSEGGQRDQFEFDTICVSESGTQELTRDRLAVLTQKYWLTKGVRLTVGFMDGPSVALREKILLHMNAWGEETEISFVYSSDAPQVRITRTPGVGHWSYLGTDILRIGQDKPTLNLAGFTEQTRESEFFRVVRHEAGHTLGFPHEHMREELVRKIDPEKAFKFYEATEGWTREEVIAQVLTPLSYASIFGTTDADPDSIMCYPIPGTLTTDGVPIKGGADISDTDYSFAARLYPKS